MARHWEGTSAFGEFTPFSLQRYSCLAVLPALSQSMRTEHAHSNAALLEWISSASPAR